MTLAACVVDHRDLAKVAAVAGAPPGLGLADLAARGGLDPARDFIGADLRGWQLAGEDLRGFDLSRADLRHTGIEDAVRDDTTILADARLDLRARRRLGLVQPRAPRRQAPPGRYTMVRIPDLSDAELLERQFVIHDPLSLNHLDYDPPPTDQWLTYEGRYDVGYEVVCAFGHRHKKGYAFRDEQGRHFLIGNSCGARHLGMGSWKVFAKGRELLEERASYLRGLRDLHDAFARRRDWIAGLDRHPAVRSFDLAMTVLHGRHPALVRNVQKASAGGGQLFLTVEERDFKAEERERERQVADAQRNGRPPPAQRPIVTRRVARAAGTLEGRAVFTNKHTLRSRLATLVLIVDAFLARQAVMTRKDLVASTRNARKQVDNLADIVAATKDFLSFFQPGNLDLFARWGEEGGYDGCRFELHPGGIVLQRPDGVVTKLERPSSETIDASPLDELVLATTKWSQSAATSRRRRL